MADNSDLDSLRPRLLRFFRSRGAADAEDLASETIFRVMQNALEGTCIRQFGAYADGVARNVLLEDRRRLSRESALADWFRIAPCSPPESREAKLHCMEACLSDTLNPREENLIRAYYRVSEKKSDVSRSILASKLGISENALRIRVSRIREKLRDCVQRSLEEKASRNKPGC